MEPISKDDRICYNCQYLRWLIGIGLGLRCGHESKSKPNELPPLVPSRYHSCEFFEMKNGNCSCKTKSDINE